MKIRIECSDPQMLTELHQLIYERDNDLLIDEHYEHTPGVQKEPIVTALITFITGKPVLNILTSAYKEWVGLRKEREKQITIRLKNDQKHTENLIKFYLSAGGKWEEIDPEQLDNIRLK